MGKRRILSAIAFTIVAMASGGIISVYEMDKNTVKIVDAAQVKTADNIQTDKISFSCRIPDCTQTTVHWHGLCGIDGCVQIGEHSHGVCSIAGCAEIGIHMHDDTYCYPHRADDGHAYHNCGAAGCTQMENHTHNSCGVTGCTRMESHTHNSCRTAGTAQSETYGNGSRHHASGHGGRHH